MKQSKMTLIALVIILIGLALCTIHIVYADNQNSKEASSNDLGFMQQSFDTKQVEHTSKTKLTSYDKSGQQSDATGNLSDLSGNLTTNSSTGSNSLGNYSEIVGGSVKKTGLHFDNEGFAKIRGRYVVICTKVFGDVGDYVDFYKENGTVIPCIIGDIKNSSNKWGTSSGKDVLDFFVDRATWYPVDEGGNASKKHVNPGTKSFHSEWSGALAKSVNGGSFFSNPTGTKTVQDSTVVDPSTDEITNKTSSEYVHQMIELLNSYSPTFKEYGKYIGYSNGYVPRTYNSFLKSVKKHKSTGANCATCINYALEDMGLIDSCNLYFKHRSGFRNVTSKLARVTKRVNKANGMSVKEASKKGLLKYGDIVGLNLSNGSQHTFVR